LTGRSDTSIFQAVFDCLKSEKTVDITKGDVGGFAFLWVRAKEFIHFIYDLPFTCCPKDIFYSHNLNII
jgi:hypothetical protein